MFQYIRLLRPFWWTVASFCVIGIGCMVVSALISDPQFTTKTVIWLRNQLDETRLGILFYALGEVQENDIIETASLAALTSVLSTSLIYIFKIPNIRRTAIRAIVFGYYENFLKKLVSYANKSHRVYRIVIVIPRYELVSQPELYWEGIKTQISRLGFNLSTIETDAAFGRNTYIIDRHSSASLPIFVDVPTTTRTLQEILELEADMSVGRGRNERWFRLRFEQLRDEFSEALKAYYPEDALPSLRFITPMSHDDFNQAVTGIVKELEGEIGELHSEVA